MLRARRVTRLACLAIWLSARRAICAAVRAMRAALMVFRMMGRRRMMTFASVSLVRKTTSGMLISFLPMPASLRRAGGQVQAAGGAMPGRAHPGDGDRVPRMEPRQDAGQAGRRADGLP